MAAGTHNKKEPVIKDKNSLAYPSRTLDPPISIVEQAKEIEKAEEFIKLKVHHRLDFILKQIKNLQEEAKNVVAAASTDMELHNATCNFQKIPGEIIYLYEDPEKGKYFSRLSQEDWKNNSPHSFIGAYRMNPDRSFEMIDDTL